MQNSKVKIDLKTRCFKFSLAVQKICENLPTKRSAWVIEDQLIRSARSIGANLVEGSSASSRLKFKKFYEIALKSSNETKYWLFLLQESKLLSKEQITALLNECIEISNMLASGVIKLKVKRTL